MIKGLILGAIIMYFYLERPEDFTAVSEYVQGLYLQLKDWIQTRA